MSARTVRSVRSLQSLKQSLHSSSTAPKPSHLLSTSRDNTQSHYASLTVNVLKQECRARGLKLNGRKPELIDRLVGFDQAKAFSSSSAAAKKPAASRGRKLKGDSSAFSTSAMAENPEIVNIGIPRAPPTAEELKKPKFKMPVAPDNQQGPPEIEADYSKHSIITDPGAALGDVHVVDGAPKVSTMNVDLGDGAPKHDEERTGNTQKNSLSSGDKSFLTALGGVIAAWWGSQYFASSKKTDKSH